jgi:hypothetical protein
MATHTFLIPKSISLITLLTVLPDRDWQMVSDAFLLTFTETPSLTSFFFCTFKLQLKQLAEALPRENDSVFCRRDKALH